MPARRSLTAPSPIPPSSATRATGKRPCATPWAQDCVSSPGPPAAGTSPPHRRGPATTRTRSFGWRCHAWSRVTAGRSRVSSRTTSTGTSRTTPTATSTPFSQRGWGRTPGAHARTAGTSTLGPRPTSCTRAMTSRWTRGRWTPRRRTPRCRGSARGSCVLPISTCPATDVWLALVERPMLRGTTLLVRIRPAMTIASMISPIRPWRRPSPCLLCRVGGGRPKTTARTRAPKAPVGSLQLRGTLCGKASWPP